MYELYQVMDLIPRSDRAIIAFELMEALDSNDDTHIDFEGRLTYHIKAQINGCHFPDIFKWILMKYLNHD